MADTQPMVPCPFCGGAARPVKHSAGVPRTMGYDQWHGVSCTACNACVGASDRRFRAASEAAAAWNRRAPQPVAREPLTDEHLRVIERMHVYAHTATLMDFARAIERAHGITTNGRKDAP